MANAQEAEKNISDSTSRTPTRLWLQAVRPFSFTASITPMLLGAALAYYNQQIGIVGNIQWLFLPLILVCGLLYHAGSNLISDYFDHKYGVDAEDTKGSSGVLVQGLLRPAQVYRAGLLLLALGTLLGITFIISRGMFAAVLGAIGLLGGYFYCGGPKGYKYIALGDLFVGMLFGPLMVFGSYYCLTGSTEMMFVFLASLPIGFLVIGILHANNTRDIVYDRRANSYTVAGMVGFRVSRLYYAALVILAYVAVVGFVATKLLPLGSILVLVTLKPAIDALRNILASTGPDDARLATADEASAQLHLGFGLTLIVGTVASSLFI
ncbi:MAG: 1,4-dihydroxy-2-naphthoate octaprenyltransferase [Gammaproteobacteria bacterium]|nr:1,4-dihydroxy-2-naphthoate octaprenyltransferase [Gammaproteobacteria bacterium]